MTYHWLEHTWIIHEIDKETSTAGDCNMLNFHSCKTYSMQWYKCPLLPPYYFLDILYIKYMGTSEPETTVDMKSLVCWSPVPYNWGQAVSGVGSRSFCFLELTWQCRYCVRRGIHFLPLFSCVGSLTHCMKSGLYNQTTKIKCAKSVSDTAENI